jgi:hypothetical protein
MLGIHPLHGHYTAGGWIAFVIAAGIVMPLVWWLLNISSLWNDHEEMFENNNDGFTAVRALQIIAMAYGLAPVIGYGTPHWWQHTLWAVFDAMWVCVLLVLAAPVLNYVVKRVHGGLNAIINNSAPTGVVLGVFYVAYGLIIGATLPGPGDSIARTFEVSLVFGLLALVFITVVYLSVSRIRMFRELLDTQTADGVLSHTNTGRKLNLGDLIGAGNWAATTLAATIVWTLGIVTSSAVAGNFTTWGDSIVTFLVAAVFMLVISIAALWLVDKFVVTRETVFSMVEKRLVRPAIIMSSFLFAAGIFASYVVS